MKIPCIKCGKPTDTQSGFYWSRGRRCGSCKVCERERVEKLRARGLCGGRRLDAESPRLPVPKQPIKQKVGSAKTFVVTWAQNATPVHEGFLACLERYCERNGARLLVIPGRYKNPTSIWSTKMEHDEWWDGRVHPYLFDGRKVLGEHIGVFGDISIQPTASRPLTGLEVFVGQFSGVFGHPRLQFKTVATATRSPRILTTTGAVTIENYTKSKAGKMGEAHHVIGACVVEEDEGRFHVRQLNATDDGSFIDVDTEYVPTSTGVLIQPAEPALALVCGDIHEAYAEEEVLNATLYAPDSLLKVARALRVVYHDTLHFDARNHHNIDDFQDRYDRGVHQERYDSVEEEIRNGIKFLDRTPDGVEAYNIAANHDEAFDRWLKTANPKTDVKNARFFHEVWAVMLKHKDKTGEWIPAFELCYKIQSPNGKVHFIRRDEPFQVADIHLNFHGDMGQDGSRGSPEAYAKLGVKTITGHTHKPAILDGAYVAGVTGSLNQRYNRLPSSWLQSDVLVYANGKRCIFNMVWTKDGKRVTWRARRKST